MITLCAHCAVPYHPATHQHVTTTVCTACAAIDWKARALAAEAECEYLRRRNTTLRSDSDTSFHVAMDCAESRVDAIEIAVTALCYGLVECERLRARIAELERIPGEKT